MREAIADGLKGIDATAATLQIAGSIRHPEIELQTDLGERIAARLGTILERQAVRLKSQLAAKVDALAAEYRRQ